MDYGVTRSGVDEPPVESLAPFVVSADDVPEAFRRAIEPIRNQLYSVGFGSGCAWFLFPNQGLGQVSCMAVLIHQSGKALARLWIAKGAGDSVDAVPVAITFLSARQDQTYLLSTSRASDLATPPGIEINELVGAEPLELWESHWRRLSSLSASPSVVIDTPEAALNVLDGHHRRRCEFYLQEGIFVPLETKPDESDAVVAELTALPVPESDRYEAIWQEIQREQDKKPGWQNALIILGVSLLVFYGAGAAAWSWEFLAMLLPVLLLHEAGHFLAMKIFGYRNVRMFFIPLFGAAVSGQHYNTPGWKKAIVSLAGPVPGILLGIVLGAVALVTELDWLLQTSLFLFVLNGFNLLPFLPLDGGWVAHAILFSRQPWLDAASRVVASLVLVLGGIAIQSIFLPILGAFMLFGVPMAFRIARMAKDLRRSGLPIMADNDRIPAEIAYRIIDTIRETMPQVTGAKTIGQVTLQVFEAANARPPGIFGSLLIGAAYVGSFMLALIAPIALVTIQYFNGGEYAPAEAEHPLVVEQIRRDEAGEASLPAEDAEISVVATFAAERDASASYENLASEVSPPYRLMQFGQTVILDLPADDDQRRAELVTRFDSKDAEIYDHPRCDVTFSLECVAPDEETAAEIETMAAQYFAIPMSMHALPPWTDQAVLTDQQRLARHTYHRLVNPPTWEDDPQLNEITEQLGQATGSNDKARRADLFKEHSDRIGQLMREYYEELRSLGPEKVDVGLIDLWERNSVEFVDDLSDEALADFDEAGHQRHLEMGARMGQLPLKDDEPVPGSTRHNATGAVSRDAQTLTFHDLYFERPYDGTHRLVQWLAEKGCSEFRYGVGGYRPPSIAGHTLEIEP